MFLKVLNVRVVLGVLVAFFNFVCKAEQSEKKDFDSLFSVIEYAGLRGSPDNSSWGKNSKEKKFWAGYQTIEIHNTVIPGSRDPFKRLKEVPYDFMGKTVLDIGTNQGGMLFALADKIKWGVGLDYNSDYINVANKIKSIKQLENVDFYTCNVDVDNLFIIGDLMPDYKVDICFLLSICCWIKKWRELIDFVHKIAPVLLFEANGSEESQRQLMKYINHKYKKVILINDNSSDEEKRPKVPRRLYLCSK